MTVVWRRFGADVGDEIEEISERTAQKRIDTRFDKLLIFKTKEGTFTTASAVHEKRAGVADAEAKKTTKKVRKLLKEKKVEEVVEIAPVAGG